MFFGAPITKLIIGAIAISFSGVWVKIADVSPSLSAFYRVLFGSLFLFVVAVRAREKILAKTSHLLPGTLCGIVFALDLICWHHSIRLVGPGLATILGNFQVFVLAGVGIYFLRERYSKLLLLAIPLAMAGLFLIVGFDWTGMTSNYRLGIYFGLATALFYSAYILTLKQLSTRCPDTFIPMLLVSTTTSIVLGLYIIAAGETFVIPDLKSLFSLVGLGFFSQCLGWLLIATSLPRTNTSTAGLILLLQPALAFLWDVLFFARPTDLLNWFGVVMTLLAIYFGLSSKKDPV
jgi:drug/metabolite transporter (DMT)-like permease